MKPVSPSWLLLVASLPTTSATPRMRLWRAIKALGCVALRDGAYLLPNTAEHSSALAELAEQTNAEGGQAWVVDMAARSMEDQVAFTTLFDRSNEHSEFVAALNQARKLLKKQTVAEAAKTVKRLRKDLEALERIDFFADDVSIATQAAWSDFEDAAKAILSPDEPGMENRPVHRLAIDNFQGRVWATRRNPWVDRLASAWLIRRFIDRTATFLWLDSPANCPKEALGFDFDHATFTHVGDMVTFEVLLASFGLDQPALHRIGTLVHYLDAGGVQPPEASGVESVLAGLRETIQNDDQLLAMASGLFDGLLTSFEKSTST
jgi:hypothetical protein